MKNLLTMIMVSFVAGVLAAMVTVVLMRPGDKQKAPEELIKDYYAAETLVMVSPHHLRKAISKGKTADFILVDLRSQAEYQRAHIAGAINIPAYKDPDHSDYGAVERIVGAFSTLPQDKEIIVYCYSAPCMTGRKVGKMLTDHGIYVRHLGIGWNEWRYHWQTWNHEHEWDQTKVEGYIHRGGDAASGQQEEGSPCGLNQPFGC